MTRFARAKGSKSSNERAPEDSTPWEVMKEQLLQAKKESDESKKREEAEKQRIENYENFLKEHKSRKRNSVWCDFPEAVSNKITKQSESPVKKKKNKQKQSSVITQPVEVIKASNKNDESMESASKKSKKKKQKQRSEIISMETECEQNGTNKIETVTAYKENISLNSPNKKKNKKNKQKSGLSEIDQSMNDDDQHKQPKVSKPNKKNKKNKIQNQVAEETSSFQDTDNNASVQHNTNKQNPNNVRQKNKKKLVDGVPVRRKPIDDRSFQLIINGKEVELVRFDGFPIMKRDAERLEELKSNMIKKGIPKSEVNRTLKLERRRAEKALARLKRDVCYNCRKGGHNLSDCPELKTKIPGVGAPDGVCFKCGSTEHRQFECKVQKDKEFRFATCFICKEPGHIARQCPDNPKGLYPNGGGCKLCGDVTHLRKDCPTIMGKKEETSIKLQTLDSTDNLEGIEQKMNSAPQESTKKPKKIKF